MSQLSLQSFINTHPSPAEPGQGGNINFWITTGSSGEFYVNGITIPLVNQESSLATVISQAEKVYFSLDNKVLVRLEGPYIKKTGTITSVFTDQYVYGNSTLFIDEIGVGDTIYVLDGGTLNQVGIVDGISDDSLLSLDTSVQYGYDISDAPYYVIGSQPVGPAVVFSNTLNFVNSDLFTAVPDESIFNGLNEYWFKTEEGTINSEYGVKISTTGENLEVTSGSFTGQLAQESLIYEAKISAKEKVVSGSLYHYYLIFDKPLEIYNNVIGITSQSLSNNTIFFEPSFTSTFKYSEYEVIGNDVQEPRKSNFLLKVDRNDSQTNPTNLTSILSSSLVGTQNTEKILFGDIQDSYYDSISWTRSRYDGTENISRNLKLPTAFTATELQLYVFESTVSSSLLIQEINNGTQVFPAPTTCYLYKENNLQSLSEGFRLFISSSISSSSSTLEVTKVNVERIDYNSLPANTDQGGTVLINLFRTEGIASYTNEVLSITIPPGNYSGSGSFVSRQETTSYVGTLTGPATRFKNIITREIASIASTTIPNTDIINYNFRALPESRVVGSSFLLEESENKKELILLKGKNVYDPKTRALYVTDTQGLIIDIVG